MTIEPGGPAILAPPKRTVDDYHSPKNATPARISTPPPASERGRLESRINSDIGNARSARHDRRGGSLGGIDAGTLSEALSREVKGERRDSTPGGGSPSRKRQRINGDRYVLFAKLGRGVKQHVTRPLCISYRTPKLIWAGSSPPARDKISMPVSTCCMMKGRQPRPRGKRRERLMASCISKEQRKLIAPFQPCCGQSCLKTQYHRRHRRQCRQTPRHLTTPPASMTLRGPIHHQTTTHLHHCLLPLLLQPHTRIYFLTCRRGITRISQDIPLPPEPHRAGTAPI